MNIIINLLGYFIQYGLNVFLTKHFTPEFFGEYSIAFRVLLLGSTITLLGSNISLFRFFSPLQKKHDTQAMHNYLRWNLLFVVKAFIVCLILAIILAFGLLLLHLFHIHDFREHHLAVYTLFLVPFCSLLYLFATYMISYNHNRSALLIRMCGFYILIALFFWIALVILNQPVTRGIVILVLAFSIFIVLLGQLFIMRKSFTQLLIDSIKTKMSDETSNNTEWRNVSLRLIFTSITYLCVMLIQLTITTIFISEKQAGLLGIIIFISSILFYVPYGAYSSIKKDIATNMTSPKGKQFLVKRMKTLNINYMIYSCIIMAFIIAFGKSILLHFGPVYVKGYAVLCVLTIAQFIYSSSTSPLQFLVYCGEEKYVLCINITMFILLLIVCFIGAYFYGFVGLAVASLAVFLVRTLIFIYRVQHKLQIKSLSVF